MIVGVYYDDEKITLILAGAKAKDVKKKLNITQVKGAETKKVEIRAFTLEELTKLDIEYETIFRR